MSCPSTCAFETPVVSLAFARTLAERIPEQDRLRVQSLALAWLLTPHPGLQVYEGIVGRDYTNQERAAIAEDTGRVRALPCPFLEGGVCVLGGLGPNFTPEQETRRPPYLFLPAAVLKLLDGPTYTDLVKRREIADAKVAFLSRNEGFHR